MNTVFGIGSQKKIPEIQMQSKRGDLRQTTMVPTSVFALGAVGDRVAKGGSSGTRSGAKDGNRLPGVN